MDIYKLKPGLHPIHAISVEQFEADTQKQSPWYQRKNDETVQYAVCPACDNPIQIISLYKRHKDSPNPYGRHVPKSIQGIATYEQEAYETCPYANPSMKLDKTCLRHESSKHGRAVLLLLRDEFDRVVYLMRKMTGIIVSEKLAQTMLQSFLDMRGYLYVGTNTCNLPWLFCYMTTSQSLFGRFIEDDSPLIHALRDNDKLALTDQNQVKGIGTEFLPLNFAFIEYNISGKGTERLETVNFIVSLGKEIIFQDTIEIDPMHFHNLVNLPPERAKRNERLLKIAEELIRI